jgi:hypothetical protein
MTTLGFDPRYITAGGLTFVGVALCVLALRVWWTHPVNRVFFLGDYVTEEGIRTLLGAVPLIFVIGLAVISSALARLAYSLRLPFREAAGLIEAIFSVWAAGSVIVVTVRLWRSK